MSERTREALLHAALAVLLAAGLTLPLLGAAGLLESHWPVGLLLPAATALVMGGLSLLPRGTLFSWLGALAGLAVWAALGGARAVQETAMGLRFTAAGHAAAFPFYAGGAAQAGCLLVSLAAWAMTARRASPVFALTAVVGALFCLWLTEHGGLVWLAFPAGAALLTMLARSRSEAVSAWRVLPFMAALMLLMVLLVPAGGLVSPPLKKAADDLRQRIMDYFFFTDPRNEFSLAREGFYPQGRSQLGGAPALNPHAVLTVETPQTVWLRGAVKNAYNGRCWEDRTGGQRYLWVGGRWSGQRAELFDEHLPAAGAGEAVTVRVTVSDANASAVFTPQRVRKLSPGGDLVPYFNNASEIFATRDLREGDSWTVTALTDLGHDARMAGVLAECALRADPARDAAAAAACMEVPGCVQREVLDLTREAVAGASTDWEKAMAIRRWLQANYRYSLNVPDVDPRYDFVSAFLLSEEKAGYCTYFASAMTIMCRAAGLPARYVEGYLARPGADGVAWVTGLDGHAWVEVWFPGYGWLTFDPTPSDLGGGQQSPEGGSRPDSGPRDEETPDPQEEEDPERQEKEDRPEDAEGGEDRPEDRQDSREEETSPSEEMPASSGRPPRDPPRLWWLWLLAALLLLAVVILLILLRIRGARPERAERKPGDLDSRWCLWIQAVCDALRTLGETRPRYSTLAQWLRSVDAKGVTPASLAPLGESAGVIFYGHQEPLEEEIDLAREAWADLRGGMTRRERIRLDLRRAFGRKRDFAKE